MADHRFQRRSRQRQLILEELAKLRSHPTAVGLYEIVRRRLPKVSLGTVYRNLDRLTQSGLIQKLDFGSDQARFDANAQPHDHVRCIRCGRVDDLPRVPLDLSSLPANDWGGYEILGHRLEFFGICPHCKKESDAC